MSETPPPAAPASEQPGGAPAPPPPPPPPAPTPPWGSDDEFDPAKAWNLISNLRDEVKDLKPLAQRAKELEDQSKTELERITDDRDGHKTRADTAEAQVARLTAALTHNLSMEDVELLGTGTAEEIEQRAKRLAERIGAGSATPQVPRGPVETLRPGAVPSTPLNDDDQLLADIKRAVGAR